MPYYKVVGPNLKSTGITTQLSKQYIQGIRVRPTLKQAPLFVFDNFANAVDYVRFFCYDGRIFTCSIKESKNEAGWGPMCPGDTDQIVKNIKSKKKYTHLLKRAGCPLNGTVFADEVILDQEVLDFPNRVFYKAVDRNLKSSMGRLSEIGFQVQYIKNQPVRPNFPKFPLMVFSDLRSAKDFLMQEELFGHKIFNCRIIKSSIPHKRFWLSDMVNAVKNNQTTENLSHRHLVKGTVFADEVTLLNEVEAT